MNEIEIGPFAYQVEGVPTRPLTDTERDFIQRQMAEVNRRMAADLAHRLYGDGAPLSRYWAKPEPKRPVWARLWLSVQSKLGRLLLAGANALGEYNDWE